MRNHMTGRAPFVKRSFALDRAFDRCHDGGMEDKLVTKSVRMPAWMWQDINAIKHKMGCLSPGDVIRRVMRDKLEEMRVLLEPKK